MASRGCIITNEKELQPGMKVELVNRDNRNDRKPAVVGPDHRIIAENASMTLAGIEKIGCHLVVL